MTSVLPVGSRPVATRPGFWRFPSSTRTRLANGLTVVGCHLPGQYLAGVSAVMDISIRCESQGQDGVLALALRSMDEGTRNHTAEDFARAVLLLGARYRNHVDLQGTWLDIDVPVRNLEQGTALLAEALRRPVFGEADLERQRAQRLGEIAHERADPDRRSRQEFIRRLFTADDRFSRPVGGTRATVEALDQSAVRAFHAGHFTPDRTTLVFAGDLTAVDVVEVADRHVGDWVTSGSAAVPGLIPVTPPRFAVHPEGRPHIVVVDRPGSVQTSLVIGCRGLELRTAASAADEAVLRLLSSHIAARVSALLRNDRGYSYGFQGAYQTVKGGGYLLANGSVRGGDTGKAVIEILGLLGSLVHDGLRPQAWAAAVNNVVRIVPLQLEKAAGIRIRLAELVAADRPLDFMDRSIAALREVTAAQASIALRDFLDAQPLTVVAVGAADEITIELARAGLQASAVVPSSMNSPANE